MANQIDVRAANLGDLTREADTRTPGQRIRKNIARAALITGIGVAALVGTAAPALAGAPVYLSQPFSAIAPI
jgi:hypothetical protein